MAGKYNQEELVKYQGKIYVIVECHAINWFSEVEPMVYGLVLANKKPNPDRGDRIYVRESLISPLSDRERLVWRLLHGKC